MPEQGHRPRTAATGVPLGGVSKQPGSKIAPPDRPKPPPAEEPRPLGDAYAKEGSHIAPPPGRGGPGQHRERIQPTEPLGGIGGPGSTLQKLNKQNGKPKRTAAAVHESARLAEEARKQADEGGNTPEVDPASTGDPGAPDGLSEKELALWEALNGGATDEQAASVSGYALSTVEKRRSEWSL